MIEDKVMTRISIDHRVHFGKSSVQGHRNWVSLILNLLKEAGSIAEVIDHYPGVDEDDVRPCIADGAGMMRERYTLWPKRSCMVISKIRPIMIKL